MLLPAVPCLFIFGFFEAIILLDRLNKVQVTKGNFTEWVHIQQVTDSEISGFANIFLKW